MSFVSPERTFGCQPGPLGPVLARIDRGRGRLEIQIERTPDVFDALAGRRRPAGPLPPPGEAPVTVREIVRIHRELAADASATPSIRTEHAGPTSTFSWRPWETPEFLLDALVAHHNVAARAALAHPVALTAAFVLDFLTLSPLASDDRRVAGALVSRILAWHGHPVGRCTDVDEALVAGPAAEGALQASQRGWADGRHSIWPWTDHVAQAIARAYEAVERQIAAAAGGVRGQTKQQQVRRFVLDYAPATFRISEIRDALPGVSDGTIRLALDALKREGRITLLAPGRDAAWRKLSMHPT
jgi:hypothetical protein